MGLSATGVWTQPTALHIGPARLSAEGTLTQDGWPSLDGRVHGLGHCPARPALGSTAGQLLPVFLSEDYLQDCKLSADLSFAGEGVHSHTHSDQGPAGWQLNPPHP